MEKKWNEILNKGDKRYITFMLTYICSFRKEITQKFKDKIVQDLIACNYIPFNEDEWYGLDNEFLPYIYILRYEV